jgi:hypothetical protein
MTNTIKAKMLLGWMNQHEAVNALNCCIFDPPLTKKKSIALWKEYRDRVQALNPLVITLPAELALSPGEQTAVDEHIKKVKAGPTARCFSSVMKVDPNLLVARQYYVVTERADQYAQEMADDNVRIARCLGAGMEFKGTLPWKQVNPKVIVVDLPHLEFHPIFEPTGCRFVEGDRYIAAVIPETQDRIVLWAGYHRLYAILTLCQGAGDAHGGAPLLTVTTGAPDVDAFFANPSSARDAVLGPRPALVRDFLDDELAITVNLRKRKAQGRIEFVRPNKWRAGVVAIDA